MVLATGLSAGTAVNSEPARTINNNNAATRLPTLGRAAENPKPEDCDRGRDARGPGAA